MAIIWVDLVEPVLVFVLVIVLVLVLILELLRQYQIA
jgi:hypothetical protein